MQVPHSLLLRNAEGDAVGRRLCLHNVEQAALRRRTSEHGRDNGQHVCFLSAYGVISSACRYKTRLSTVRRGFEINDVTKHAFHTLAAIGAAGGAPPSCADDANTPTAQAAAV